MLSLSIQKQKNKIIMEAEFYTKEDFNFSILISETWDFVDGFDTLEEAEKTLRDFEEEDGEEGNYEIYKR